MSRTLATWSFALRKQTGEKGVWLLLPASLKAIFEKLSLNRQREKNEKTVQCILQKHLQSWETFLPLETLQQIVEKMTWVVKHLFLLTVWTVRLYRRKPFSLWDAQGDVPHEVHHPLSCCRSWKMLTGHVIYQCPVQKTVNNVRTNGKTRNMAWSNW